MKATTLIEAVFRTLLLATFFITFPAHADHQSDAGARAVVEDFNTAITARDMDTALALLAEGSVQFQLRALHPGMSDSPPLTADLNDTWKAVAGSLFTISESYERVANISQAHAQGYIATVWTNTTTRTVGKDNGEPMELSFSEVYLLIKKPGGWKIAGIADNRKPDNIQVDGESQPTGDIH